MGNGEKPAVTSHGPKGLNPDLGSFFLIKRKLMLEDCKIFRRRGIMKLLLAGQWMFSSTKKVPVHLTFRGRGSVGLSCLKSEAKLSVLLRILSALTKRTTKKD